MARGHLEQSRPSEAGSEEALALLLVQLVLLPFLAWFGFWSFLAFILILAIFVAALIAAKLLNFDHVLIAVTSLLWGIVLSRLGSFLSEGFGSTLAIVGFGFSYLFNSAFSSLDDFATSAATRVATTDIKPRTSTGTCSYENSLNRDTVDTDLRAVFALPKKALAAPLMKLPSFSIGIARTATFALSLVALVAFEDYFGYVPEAPENLTRASKQTWLELDRQQRKLYERLSDTARIRVDEAPVNQRQSELYMQTELRRLENAPCRYGGTRETGCLTKREKDAGDWALEFFLSQ